MPSRSLKWVKCNSGKLWCNLKGVKLGKVKTTGVYIIWYFEDSDVVVVRVGQGDIADRVSHHRNDKKIMDYEECGTLYVTWAPVPESSIDGIEKYLGDHLKPRVGKEFPPADPITVNLPPW